MAKWLWPGQSAIGKRIHLGVYDMHPPWMTVVGVATDLKRYSLTESPRPEMIVPYTQKPYPSFSTMQFVVRSSLPASQLLPALTRAVGTVDPGIPISRVRTIGELVTEASGTARFATRLMISFGASALILAMIGLYGVIAYGVHQRRQGVRCSPRAGRGPRGHSATGSGRGSALCDSWRGDGHGVVDCRGSRTPATPLRGPCI